MMRSEIVQDDCDLLARILVSYVLQIKNLELS